MHKICKGPSKFVTWGSQGLSKSRVNGDLWGIPGDQNLARCRTVYFCRYPWDQNLAYRTCICRYPMRSEPGLQSVVYLQVSLEIRTWFTERCVSAGIPGDQNLAYRALYICRYPWRSAHGLQNFDCEGSEGTGGRNTPATFSKINSQLGRVSSLMFQIVTKSYIALCTHVWHHA